MKTVANLQTMLCSSQQDLSECRVTLQRGVAAEEPIRSRAASGAIVTDPRLPHVTRWPPAIVGWVCGALVHLNLYVFPPPDTSKHGWRHRDIARRIGEKLML